MTTPRFFTRLAAGALLLAGMFIANPANAMANFARKYGYDCNMCHTTVPRLNRFGYNFRKAGFRLPEEIGQSQKMTMDNAMTARIQVLYNYNRKESFSGPVATPLSTTVSNNQLTVLEVTLYPLTGSFGKYYGSMTELSLMNDSSTEIENAYIRYSRGSADSWFTGRIGIFHPFEGYGASDRPFSLSRPFFQTTSADNSGAVNSSTGKTLFTIWNFDQAGMELAYVWKNSTFSATLYNGMATDGIEMHPAAGGNEQKIAGQSTKNSKDIQLFFNQVLKKDGSGISAYYYSGHTTLPNSTATPTATFQNDYDRFTLYGSWMFMPKLGVQAGYQIGTDHAWNTINLNGNDTFKSKGWFAEVDSPINEHLTLGARYDTFDPSDRVSHNNKTGYTLFANAPFGDGMQIVGDYKHTTQQRFSSPAGSTNPTLPDTTTDDLSVRLIWIW